MVSIQGKGADAYWKEYKEAPRVLITYYLLIQVQIK